MEDINWVEVIGGVVIAIIGGLLINKNNSIAVMALLLGGYHVGKGLYEGKK